MQERYRYTVTLLPTPKDPSRPVLSVQTEDAVLAQTVAAMLHTANGYFYEPALWQNVVTGEFNCFTTQGVKVEKQMIAGDMAEMMRQEAGREDVFSDYSGPEKGA